MLHSEILPEQDCGGELIELPKDEPTLKDRVVICSYNDHCSAPFSRAFWLVATTKVYSGPGSRHCHGINYTHNRLVLGVIARQQQSKLPLDLKLILA